MIFIIILLITIVFILLGVNIFNYLFSIAITTAFNLNLDYVQIKYLLSVAVERIIKSDELITIPFYIILSLFFIRYKILENLFKFIIKLKLSKFFKFFLMFFIPSLFLPSSVLSNKFILAFLKRYKLMDKKDTLIFSHIFAIFNFLSPLSIPILVYAFLLKLSLKTVFLTFSLFSLIYFFANYLIFLRKIKVNTINLSEYDKRDTVLTIILFLLFIYMLFVPYSIFDIILFMNLIFVGYIIITKKWHNKINLLIINEVFERSGVLLGLLIMLFFFNILVVYGKYNDSLSNLVLSFFSDKYILIMILLLISFVMCQFFDPLAVLIILFPFYNVLINEYMFNKYIFGYSFMGFLTLGFFSMIKNLMLHHYVSKLNYTKSEINVDLLGFMLFIGLFSMLLIFIV
ncbi:hypothetical protein DEFDS_1374 [Deferribacter desulfuricans SSM1]|uniref:Uncharacterized protein n=1 Tax=Deferribacter desulfuricans (strain DSM 14783 / JCM 11476 / NBRC 101012 / SSM1) TaxID=639282 RepID=D3PE12_DEFDS|nr:hypothetical protein [Deferribacter desulfuricans]BAI80835.1 hypothetical protein DEFDS_1374 [Deferribacter desulfuricans SSM1]